ncbi:Uncharacterized conserved protein [Plasmopara halstedii]|uniref:Uncharacterized conserved protein n=1 Tax=Plasmopara halstedii TaxID=4781 RepID=A0A0P1AHJ9_PLAHL|nr:Uncharacterized conserved protein [Plasmopara halstedii]CEG40303.1 Uncharacterized conserved protein [Plasmopara halstedii]|eukprot:XP_024576672.1 Uncharacterized conserved protein [Plasmopara halstedii]
MVATPKFHVTQDTTWVFVHVHVPYVRVSDMEFYVDGVDFTFYCKPYLLKLHFPYEVMDDELAKAVYDPNKDNGTIVIHLPKKEPGQYFTDLDMLTKLLLPQSIPTKSIANCHGKAPLIEVLESTSPTSIGTFQEENDRLNALIDGKSFDSKTTTTNTSISSMESNSSLLKLETSAPQKVINSITLNSIKTPVKSTNIRVTEVTPTYGFNRAYSNFFRVWHGEVSEIISLPDPEHVQTEERRNLREDAEEKMFDIERYLMDVGNQKDDMYFKLAMTYEPFWRKYPVLTSNNITREESTNLDINRMNDSLNILSLNATLSPSSTVPFASETSVTFTDIEQEILLRLPRKEYLLPEGSDDEILVIGGLVDILIGFVYDQLTTQGDSGVESTWTVSILSPTLSWLDSNSDLHDVIRSAIRRMITFPFLRQYDLAMRCVEEANEVLKRGKRVVLRALLTLYRIIEKSETQYLLNSLYIQDYCVWIQSVSNERLQQVSVELDKQIAAFTKSKTGWALEELERRLFETDCEHETIALSSSSDSDYDNVTSSEEDTSDDSSS